MTHSPAPQGPDPAWRPGHERDDHRADSVVVDCDACVVRGPVACGDCVVSVLLGGPPADVDDTRADGVEHVTFDADEHAALEVLANVGVVPPLRLVTPVTPVTPGEMRPEHL